MGVEDYPLDKKKCVRLSYSGHLCRLLPVADPSPLPAGTGGISFIYDYGMIEIREFSEKSTDWNSVYLYSIIRAFQTIIGVSIAWFINVILLPYPPRPGSIIYWLVERMNKS